MSSFASTLTIDQALQQAVAKHNVGDLSGAERLYRSILQVHPHHPDANYNLGLLAVQVNQPVGALPFLKAAFEANPGHQQYWFSYTDALIKADQPDVAHQLLMQGHEQGLPRELLEGVARQLAVVAEADQGSQKPLQLNRKQRRSNEKKIKVAEHNKMAPPLAEVDHVVALLNQCRYAEAESLARSMTERFPNHAISWAVMGDSFQLFGRLDEAEASYRRALAIKPDYSETHCNLGGVLWSLGRLDEAEVCCRRALKIKPDLTEAHSNLGNVFKERGHLDEAEASCHRALAIKPEYAEAHNNLGNVLKDLGRLDEAEASYRRALAIKPDYAEAHCNLLFTSNYRAHSLPLDCLEQARQYGRMLDSKVAQPFSTWHCAPLPTRLRVGLVSGDLKSHPVGFFLENLLSQIDSSRIELFAYSTGANLDELTARIKPYFSAWKSLVAKSDKAAADLIHADGVHLLLDLSGHTAKNRLQVFAWKPAPVQATWLGYFATTGVSGMDYLLGDPYVTPDAEAGYFTETIWRLPESYLCFTPPDTPLEVEPLPALTSQSITFGCFNNLAKMNDAVVALWAKLLHAVPNSRLFLKTKQLNSPGVCDATCQRFAVHGIAPDRLLLEGHSPRLELLKAYNRVDMALDPFPYPGGTTSVEGLWMGVPVITRRGDRFLSHIGESIANNAGLSDWIADTDDDYVAKAVNFASDLQKLATLRSRLRQQVLTSALFDAQRFARHLESAWWGMWEKRLNSMSSTHLQGDDTVPGKRPPLEQHKPAAGFNSPDVPIKRVKNKVPKSLPQNRHKQPPNGPSQAELDILIGAFTSGQYTELERLARIMTARYPYNSFGWKALGTALIYLSRPADALMSLQKSIQINPNDYEVHSTIGNTLKGLGRLSEAEASYRQAIALKPDFAEAYYNMGNTLGALGRLPEAEASYRQAITLKPDFAAAYYNMGKALGALGRLPEAEASYRQAITLKPDFAAAYYNMGKALGYLRRLSEAEASYRQAIAVKPDYAEAHYNLANTLGGLGRLPEAEASYRQAIALKPDALHYRYVAELLLPKMALSSAEILGWRDHFYAGINKLWAWEHIIDDPCKEFTALTFDLAYHAKDDRQFMAELSRLFRKKAPSLTFVAPHIATWQSPVDRRIRVGVCSQYLVGHTIGKLYLGLLQNIDRSRFEILLFHAPHTKRDQFSAIVDQSVDKVLQLPLALAAQQHTIAEEQLDVLFYPDIGMSPATYFLAHARLAPVQVVSWGHPDTTGIDTLDYFVSSSLIEPVAADELYSERLIRLHRLPCFYQAVVAPMQIPARGALGLPEAGTLYGCPQSLFKFHPDFDAILAQIAEGDPTGHIVLIEGCMSSWTNLLKNRWRDSYPILNERVIFLPQQPLEHFMALMAHFDVLLDPIHFGSGNTLYEAMVYGTPTVTWPGHFMRGRIVAGAYRQMEINGAPVVEHLEDYAPLALALGKDNERCKQLRQATLQAAGGKLFSDMAAVREFEHFLLDAVTAAGKGIKLPAGWHPRLNAEVE